MKFAVVGSRDYKDRKLVEDIIDSIVSYNDIIVTGGANGVDSWAMDYAKKYDIELEVFYPDWDQYGKAAGPMRNESIIKNSDIVLAFWDGKSRGTKNSIDLALKYKKDLRVYFDGK